MNKIDLKDKIFIMDNVPFHKSTIIREWFSINGVHNLYIPPYSPELNPIEEVFSMVKSKYNAIKPRAITKIGLVGNIERVIHSLKNAKFFNFYQHMRSFIPKSINMESFF
ncbi:Transposable element Tc1 transposase [Dictyocoela muelleri]|nr:Transposable element Tc1 transposase [Dictyocoela muelleri]